MNENKTLIENLLEQGQFLIDAHKYEKAIEIFQKVVDLDPNNLIANFGLGCCLMEIKRLPEAKEVTTKALLVNPTSSILYNNLGRISWLEKDKKEALEYFKKALELEPNLATNLFNCYKFNSLVKPKQRTQYINFLFEALKLKPNDYEYLASLAGYYNYTKDYSKSQETYLNLLKIDPNNPAILNDYGVLLISLKDTKKAKKMFLNSLRINPNLKQAENNFISIISRENKFFLVFKWIFTLFVSIPFLPIYALIQAIKFESENDSKEQLIRFCYLILSLVSVFFLLPQIFYTFKLNYILLFYGVCLVLIFAVCLPLMKKLDKIQESLLQKELSKVKLNNI